MAPPSRGRGHLSAMPVSGSAEVVLAAPGAARAPPSLGRDALKDLQQVLVAALAEQAAARERRN